MRSLLLAAALLASTSLGMAQDLSSEFGSDLATTSASAPSPLSVSGDHSVIYHQPLWADNWSYASPALEPEMDNALGFTYKTGHLKFVANGTVKTFASPQTWTSLSQFELGETYLSWTPGQFLVNLGFQVFNWGVADKFNPSDGLNARDYAVSMDAPKIPLLAADVRWFPAKWLSVEGVVSPYQSPSRFPVDFTANTQAGLDTTAAELTSSPLGSYYSNYSPQANAVFAPNDPNSAVVGARLNFYSAVDLGLSYIYDIDPYGTPEVTMKSIPGPSSTTLWVPQQVTLVYKRIHRFGVDAKTTVGPLGLWGEGGFDLTENPSDTSDQIRRNRLAWTLGMDFNWGYHNNFYTNLQYIGSWIPGYDQTTQSDYASPLSLTQLTNEAYMQTMTYRQLTQTLGDYTETWLQGLTFKLKFPFASDTITPSVSGVFTVPFGYDSTLETRYASLAIKPELDLMPVDSFHLKVGADLAWAWVKKAGQTAVTVDTTVDRIGVYTPYNDVYISIDYQWTTQ